MITNYKVWRLLQQLVQQYTWPCGLNSSSVIPVIIPYSFAQVTKNFAQGEIKSVSLYVRLVSVPIHIYISATLHSSVAASSRVIVPSGRNVIVLPLQCRVRKVCWRNRQRRYNRQSNFLDTACFGLAYTCQVTSNFLSRKLDLQAIYKIVHV